MKRTVYKHAGMDGIIKEAAYIIIRSARSACAERGYFSLVLSGGSTPERLYRHLAGCDLPWGATHIFWGDERCIAADHPASNYRMAADSLLAHVPIPAANIHRIQGEVEPHHAARKYEEDIRSFFGMEHRFAVLPSFDIVLLGLGEDGHTASLFPGSEGLEEEISLVVATTAPEGMLVHDRISMTFPIINNAERVCFIVSGRSKLDVVERILGGAETTLYPAAGVRARRELVWIVDVGQRMP